MKSACFLLTLLQNHPLIPATVDTIIHKRLLTHLEEIYKNKNTPLPCPRHFEYLYQPPKVYLLGQQAPINGKQEIFIEDLLEGKQISSGDNIYIQTPAPISQEHDNASDKNKKSWRTLPWLVVGGGLIAGIIAFSYKKQKGNTNFKNDKIVPPSETPPPGPIGL